MAVNCTDIDQIDLSNMKFLCELISAILRLPYLFSMATGVSSMVVFVNSETSDSVNSFNFAMCAFTCKCVSIVLGPCSEGG